MNSFPKKSGRSSSFDQFDRAYGKDLQRFDRAALSILYLHAAIEELKLDCNLYHMVRIRPVTFFIDGYTRAFYDRYVQPREKEIKSQIIQPAGVLAAMADGQTFVTRKTADLLIRVLPEVQRENLTVECGQLRSRSRGSKKSKTIWPCASEQVHFHEDEYLSPRGLERVDSSGQDGSCHSSAATVSCGGSLARAGNELQPGLFQSAAKGDASLKVRSAIAE